MVRSTYCDNTDIKNNDLLLHQSGFMTIGFLGSSENNDFFKDIFEYGLKGITNKMDYQSYGVDLFYKKYNTDRTKPLILNRIIGDYSKLNIYNIPDSLIYQYDWTKIGFNFSQPVGLSGFQINSIGYHWFGGSEISQNYNNILTEDNFKEYKITFSTLINEKNII